MAVRSTSKRAYGEVSGSGLTQVQQEQIVDYLFAEDAPMTLREIQAFTGIDINAVSGRCNELKRSKRLFEHPKRKCTITGRLVTPVHPQRPPDPGDQGTLFSREETIPRIRHVHHTKRW